LAVSRIHLRVAVSWDEGQKKIKDFGKKFAPRHMICDGIHLRCAF